MQYTISDSKIRCNFTAYDDDFINVSVSNQIREISNLILAQVPDITSLVLLGGFARGEGSIVKEFDRITPLGDYDLLIVTKNPHLSMKLNGLDDLVKGFGLKHADYAYIWKPMLRFAKKSIFWYEVKFGSKVIWGDKRIINHIPIQSVRDIDLREGIKLLLNRLAGMFQCFDYKNFENNIPEKQREYIIYQCVKAILACGESLLLLIGRYNPKFYVKAQALETIFGSSFEDLTSIDPELLEDFLVAVDFKLRPRFHIYTDPLQLWFNAKRHLLNTLIYFFERQISTKIDEMKFPETLMRYSRPDSFVYIKYNLNIFKKEKTLRCLFQFRKSFYDIFGIALYYLALATSNTLNEAILNDSIQYIKKLGFTNRQLNSENKYEKWRLTRDYIIKAWTCL
jgi:predicted nucleotidyltransferase